MNPFLMKQPGFNEKSKAEIYRNIKKEGFDPFILHNPTFELQPLANSSRFEGGGVLAFSLGLRFNLAVCKNLKICAWKRNEERGENQLASIDSLAKKLATDKEPNFYLNPFEVISRLAGDRRSAESLNVRKFVANKDGTFALLLADNFCLAILAEFGEIRVVDKNLAGAEIICAAIIEEPEQEDPSRLSSVEQRPSASFKFFLGTVRGVLKFGEIVVKDRRAKRAEGNILESLINVYEFKANETQQSVVNGLVTFAYDGKNHLFVSVDKRLFHLSNNSTFDNFAKNFSTYFKEARMLLESGYFNNSLFAVELFANYAFALFVVDSGGIHSATLNLLDGSLTQDSLPILDKDGRQLSNFPPGRVLFHPFALHYALVYEHSVVIVSTVSKEVKFLRAFDNGIKNIAANPANKNMALDDGVEITEVKAFNEMKGSFIHLIEQEMQELAFLVCEQFDISFTAQAVKSLAFKNFGRQKYTEAVKQLFNAGEPFEKIAWKIYEVRKDSERFFHALIELCLLSLEKLEAAQNDSQKTLKKEILLVFLVEMLSYKFMEVSRLLEIKSQNREFHLNIALDEGSLKFYEDLLSETLKQHAAALNQEIVSDILQSHGNFHFGAFFASLKQNFYEIVYDNFYAGKNQAALRAMKSFFQHVMKQGKEKRDFSDGALRFAELMEKFGEELAFKEPTESGELLKEILALSSLKLFQEDFFSRCLCFLGSKRVSTHKDFVKILVR